MDIKIEIETASPEQQQRYLDFCKLFHRCRFEKNGVIRCKFEMFGAIERGEVDIMKLWSRRSEWKIVEIKMRKK